jgi:hypothetical protein
MAAACKTLGFLAAHEKSPADEAGLIPSTTTERKMQDRILPQTWNPGNATPHLIKGVMTRLITLITTLARARAATRRAELRATAYRLVAADRAKRERSA